MSNTGKDHMKRKITKGILVSLKACRDAKGLVWPLLPLTIHTDPEKNINVAIKLINWYENTNSCGDPDCTCRRDLIGDLDWLLYEINKDRMRDLYALTNEYHGMSREGILLHVVQLLSFIAEPKKRRTP